jgi:hypothetical protein
MLIQTRGPGSLFQRGQVLVLNILPAMAATDMTVAARFIIWHTGSTFSPAPNMGTGRPSHAARMSDRKPSGTSPAPYSTPGHTTNVDDKGRNAHPRPLTARKHIFKEKGGGRREKGGERREDRRERRQERGETREE